jgi:hypothetical protein
MNNLFELFETFELFNILETFDILETFELFNILETFEGILPRQWQKTTNIFNKAMQVLLTL